MSEVKRRLSGDAGLRERLLKKIEARAVPKKHRLPTKTEELSPFVRGLLKTSTRGAGMICAACEEDLDHDDAIPFGEGIFYCDECLPATVTRKTMGLTLLPLIKTFEKLSGPMAGASEDALAAIRELGAAIGVPAKLLRPEGRFEIEIVVADSTEDHSAGSGVLLFDHTEDGVGSEDEDPLII